MNPEVIANLWSFVRGSYIQELGVRLYMVSGTDDEKTEFLKSLAPFDYRFSRRFPVPGGLKGIKAEGLETALSGVNYLDYFREVWDTVIKSLPMHPVGLGGKTKASVPFTGSNLLSVYTAIEVDSDGKHRPCLPDPQRAKNEPRLILNRWAFADQGTSEVFAIAGRAYLAAGNDGQLAASLSKLAPDDYWLASRCALAKTSATSEPSALLSSPSSFEPALQDIQKSISASKLDVASQKAAKFAFQPSLATVKNSVVMENQDGKTSISSVSAHAPPMSMPISIRCPKCGKNLKCKSEVAGKRVKCPACKEAILVPLQESGSPSSTPDSARPASHAPQKRSFFGWLFGAKTGRKSEPSPQKRKEEPPSDPRAAWTEPAQYANALIDLVGQPVQWETTGLEKNSGYVRLLGEEINQKFGFKGMQIVWEQVRRAKGPSATSDLNRIWDGVGQWQK